MSDRHCRYCQQLFQLSPYHPNQFACHQTDCQKHRRRDYHRQKIASDPIYRQVCLDSAHKWCEEHPDYWKRYREAHPRAVERNRQRQQQRDQKRRLVQLANNNLALRPKTFDSRGLAVGTSSQGSCQQHLGSLPSPDFPSRRASPGPSSGFLPTTPLWLSARRSVTSNPC
jgi:hypothetical protein